MRSERCEYDSAAQQLKPVSFARGTVRLKPSPALISHSRRGTKSRRRSGAQCVHHTSARPSRLRIPDIKVLFIRGGRNGLMQLPSGTV